LFAVAKVARKTNEKTVVEGITIFSRNSLLIFSKLAILITNFFTS